MDIIVQWLITALIAVFAQLFKLIGSLSYDLFEQPLFTTLFTIANTIGYSLFVVGMIIMMMNCIKKVADGDGFRFMDLMFRIALGSALLTYGTKFFLLLYRVILEVSGDIITVIAGYSLPEDFTIKLSGTPNLFLLIMLIIAVFYIFKTVFSLGERFWYVCGTLMMMYAYLFQYVLGNDEAMSSWIKQMISISLTQILQSIFITTALALFVTNYTNIGMFFISLCGIIAASNIEKILDKFALTSGGKAGNVARNAMSSAYYVKMLSTTKAAPPVAPK